MPCIIQDMLGAEETAFEVMTFQIRRIPHSDSDSASDLDWDSSPRGYGSFKVITFQRKRSDPPAVYTVVHHYQLREDSVRVCSAKQLEDDMFNSIVVGGGDYSWQYLYHQGPSAPEHDDDFVLIAEDKCWVGRFWQFVISVFVYDLLAS